MLDERSIDLSFLGAADSSSLCGSSRAGVQLWAEEFSTPWGAMIAVADRSALHLLEFVERKNLLDELRRLRASAVDGIGQGMAPPLEQIKRELKDYFETGQRDFQVPLVLHGTPFERSVWELLRKIPFGATWSYGQVACALGRPQAARAVGRAVGRNQLAIVIPCHRVIAASGRLSGYAGGVWRKEKLLAHEARFAGIGGRLAQENV